MTKKPLVSVVIPFFNAEKTIRETLENVINQTYSPMEIILVNDGSTDHSVEFIQDLIDQYESITLVTQDNAGVAAARNTGIDTSQGKYIAPIDADDLWHPQRLEMHIEALENASDKKMAVAYSPAFIIDEAGYAIHKPNKHDLSGDVFEAQLDINLVGNGSGLTIRKDALVKIGGYSTMLREKGAQGCEDYMVQMMLAHDYHYISVPYYLIGYRVYDGNMSSDEIKMLRSRFMVYEYCQNTYKLSDNALFKGRKTALIFHTMRLIKKKQILKSWPELAKIVHKICHPVYFICIILRISLYKVYIKMSRGIKRLFGAHEQGQEKLSFLEIIKAPPQT